MALTAVALLLGGVLQSPNAGPADVRAAPVGAEIQADLSTTDTSAALARLQESV